MNVDLKDHIAEEIRMRYAKSSILPYDDNFILHKMYNEGLTEEDATRPVMNENLFGMSSYTLSNFQNSPVPVSLNNPLTQELLDRLGVRPTKEDFQTIREKGIKLCLVGYGGAMINMLYNMYLWSMELSEIGVFDKLVIFEEDTIDFSNLPRLGKPLINSYHADASCYYDEVPNLKTLPKILLVNEEKYLSKERKVIVFKKFLNETYANKINEKGYVFVGAPTLETRNMLSDKPFYFFGHGDHEVEIKYQPRITSGLAVETYGSIDIPVLLINLQIATAAFIKELASDHQPGQGEIRFSFDMEKFIKEEGEQYAK